MIWPFKKKHESFDIHELIVQQLEAWRPIGGQFEYLGRRMIVAGHSRLVFSPMHSAYRRPQLRADYADDHGVIHSIAFSAAESVAIMAAQP